jgi:hypothetical protein
LLTAATNLKVNLHEHRCETTRAWLAEFRQRLAEVEEETEEAFRARKQLVKFLVAGITAGNRKEDGSAEIRITYRFGPPGGVSEGSTSDDSQDLLAGDYWSVGSLMKGKGFCTPATTAPTLTIVAIK